MSVSICNGVSSVEATRRVRRILFLWLVAVVVCHGDVSKSGTAWVRRKRESMRASGVNFQILSNQMPSEYARVLQRAQWLESFFDGSLSRNKETFGIQERTDTEESIRPIRLASSDFLHTGRMYVPTPITRSFLPKEAFSCGLATHIHDCLDTGTCGESSTEPNPNSW